MSSTKTPIIQSFAKHHNCCFIASHHRNFDLPAELSKENTLFFPETSMTTNDLLFSGRPDGLHVVTDSHMLVALYSREEVFIYNDITNTWINPEFQTYGASYNLILSRLWKYSHTIPQAVLSGIFTNVMGHHDKRS